MSLLICIGLGIFIGFTSAGPLGAMGGIGLGLVIWLFYKLIIGLFK